MKVFVDTSALVALLDADDRRHEGARTAFGWLARNAELVTHNYVEVEAIAVVRRRLGGIATDALVSGLLPAIRVEWVDESLHREALAAHRLGPASASLVDEVSFALMRRLGITTAFAFDADFDHQGFGRPDVPTPGPDTRRVREAPAPYGSRAAGEDLVSVAEIAARSGRSVNTVQSWRRRRRDFPEPVAQLAAGPIWSWTAIEDWIDEYVGRRAAA